MDRGTVYSVLLAITVIGILLGVAVLAGVVPTDGGTSDQESTPTPTLTSTSTPVPTKTPTQTPPSTPTRTPTSTSTPTQTPTSTPTQTPDTVDNKDGVNVIVFGGDKSTTVDWGNLVILTENGTVVREFDLSRRPANTFEGLEPGHNYTARVGDLQSWSPIVQSFDPGQTDKIELVAQFQYSSTESYRFHTRSVEHNTSVKVFSKGLFDSGNFTYMTEPFGHWELEHHEDGPIDVALQLRMNGVRYVQKNPPDGRWFLNNETDFNFVWWERTPYLLDEFEIVQSTLGLLNNTEKRTYLGTQTLNDSTVPEFLTEPRLGNGIIPVNTTEHIRTPNATNGTTVHVYRVELPENRFPWSGETAKVYIDSETGYVLRWQSTSGSQEDLKQYEAIVIDFFDHGNVSVERGEYDLPDE